MLDFLLRERKYYKPRSLTWWTGVSSMAFGFILMSAENRAVYELGVVVAAFMGDVPVSPASFILTGLAFIGLRGQNR